MNPKHIRAVAYALILSPFLVTGVTLYQLLQPTPGQCLAIVAVNAPLAVGLYLIKESRKQSSK